MICHWLSRVSVGLLILSGVGCTTNFWVPPSLPPLDEKDFVKFHKELLPQLNIDSATLAAFFSNIHVHFDADNCPSLVTDINQCPTGIVGVCRGAPGNTKGVVLHAKFTSGVSGQKFGIEFEALNPCTQSKAALANTNSSTVMCNIKSDGTHITQILKYKVLGTDSCTVDSKRVLDPYLIIVR